MSKGLETQAVNKITLQGKLLDVQFGSGKLPNGGQPYERATATIRVKQTYGGKEEISEIPVGFFATEFTKKGAPNPAWKTIQDLKTFKTMQKDGAEADTVRVTSATLAENSFPTRTGNVVSGWQIRGSFINKANATDAASFNTEIFILSMDDELDREGDPTGRMVIQGGIVQYGGGFDIVNFIVEDPDTKNYISRHWEVHKTLNVMGRIRVTSTEITPVATTNSGWGEAIPEGPTTRLVRELIITTGDDEPREDEFGYDPGEMNKAFRAHKAKIEQMQIDAQNRANKAPAKAAPQKEDLGWEY